MEIPIISSLNVSGKRVIVRADVDLGDEIRQGDEVKLLTVVPTLNYLIQKKSKVIIIGHRGRPGGKKDPNLSLKGVSELLSKLLKKEVFFVDEVVGEKVKRWVEGMEASSLLMLENLRFDPREEGNDEEFARELSFLGEIFVNEAFSSSHRSHASIVGLPKFLPHSAGFRFVGEIKHLSKVIETPQRPLIFIISGVKKDKIEMIKSLKDFADKILVAGRLPEFMKDYQDAKVILADLKKSKKDITLESVQRFKKEISTAKTIVLAGVVGKYEEEKHRFGTKLVFEAVSNSKAYKVAGGGDTEAALKILNLTKKFNWISVGGGAMLEFFSKKNLPGIKALLL